MYLDFKKTPIFKPFFKFFFYHNSWFRANLYYKHFFQTIKLLLILGFYLISYFKSEI